MIVSKKALAHRLLAKAFFDGDVLVSFISLVNLLFIEITSELA